VSRRPFCRSTMLNRPKHRAEDRVRAHRRSMRRRARPR
jgi:hypothetical protein